MLLRVEKGVSGAPHPQESRSPHTHCCIISSFPFFCLSDFSFTLSMSENRVIQHDIYKNKQISLLFIKPQFSVLKLSQWLCSGRQPFPSGLPEGSHLRTSFLAVWLLFSFPLPTGPPHIQSLTDLLAQGFEAGFLVGFHEKGKPSFRWILSLWGVLFPASGFL